MAAVNHQWEIFDGDDTRYSPMENRDNAFASLRWGQEFFPRRKWGLYQVAEPSGSVTYIVVSGTTNNSKCCKRGYECLA